MHNQSRFSAASCFSSDKVIQAPAAIRLFPPLPGTKGRGSGTLSPLFLFHLCYFLSLFLLLSFHVFNRNPLFLPLNVGLSRVSVGQMRLSAVEQIRFPGIDCTLTWVLVQGEPGDRMFRLFLLRLQHLEAIDPTSSCLLRTHTV